MKILRDEEEIRSTVREVTEHLADDRYDAILDLLTPTPDRDAAIVDLAEGIRTHGTYDPTLPPDGTGYRVVPLREEFRETFERFLRIDLQGRFGRDDAHAAGMAFAFLPLDGEYEGDVSDLRIEFPIRRVPEGFVLERIDVRST